MDFQSILSSIIKSFSVSTEEAKAFVKFEEAIANLQKVTGEGYVSSKVLVDELSERFTEKQPEIASILYRYAAAGGDWSDLNRHIFSKPLTYYQGKDISLSNYIATIPLGKILRPIHCLAQNAMFCCAKENGSCAFCDSKRSTSAPES